MQQNGLFNTPLLVSLQKVHAFEKSDGIKEENAIQEYLSTYKQRTSSGMNKTTHFKVVNWYESINNPVIVFSDLHPT